MDDLVPNQLFVAGYSRSRISNDRDVKDIFRKYGNIKEVVYKGSFAFVTFSTEQEAQEALQSTSNQMYNGQRLKVSIVDNRRNRRQGPSEGDACFKCGKGGHWARDCPNMRSRSPRRSIEEEGDHDPTLEILRPDLRGSITITRRGDIAEAEVQEERGEEALQEDAVLNRPCQAAEGANRHRYQNEKGIRIKKKGNFRKNLVFFCYFFLLYIILMKRTTHDLNQSLSSSNQEYVQANSLCKELYLENQKRIQEQQVKEQHIEEPIVIDDDDNDDQKEQEVIEVESLAFDKGTFCLNCLTQYPKNDRQDHLMPFINLLYENSHIDVKETQPKKTLQSALMTCYGFEDELLVPIARSGVQLTIVNDNNNIDRKPNIIEKYQGFENWKIIQPSKHGSGTYAGAFHPKIWMLKFPTFLRVVIGSQNLHVADWTIWSQGMWVKDFPKRQKELDQCSSEFKAQLKEFMVDILPTNQNFQQLLQIKYDEYDFSGVDIQLITSIPGRYTGNAFYKYGLMRLQSVINQEQVKNKLNTNSVTVTYQTTSLGQLDYAYLDFIKQSALGKKYSPKAEGQKSLVQEEESYFKIIYPTEDYIVNKTHGGVDFANPLFLNKSQYTNPKFPKALFHQFLGNSEHYFWHEGTIPHLKVMIITNTKCEITDETSIYIGSHNLSQAAWGRLEKSNTQLYIANTELGILYPPKQGSMEEKKKLIQQLPFEFPPKKYEENDKPWIAEMYFQ